MEAFLIRALQLILCFSILIVLHEGGHFLAARLFKIRVEKFCLFFDPWFSLFKWKPKKSDTQYTLGWLPLGGYVKIAGMIDESMDKKQLEQPVQPWEFRAKPAWQRLIVMLAGVFVNFILALFIYAMVLFVWGDTYVPIDRMTDGLKYNERAQQLGFRDGDIPLRTERVAFTRFDDTQSIGDVYRAISEAREVTVLRDGHEVKIPLPGELNMLEMMKEQPPFMLALAPSVVDSVMAGSPADGLGIRAGDCIVGFNGKPIATWNEFTDELARIGDILAAKSVPEESSPGLLGSCTSPRSHASAADSLLLRQVTLTVRRTSGEVDTLRGTLDADFHLGVMWNHPFTRYETKTVRYGFFESFPAGISHGWKVLCGYVDDLKYLFTSDGAKSVGSFGAIGALFPATWQWNRFWEMTAFISLMLAFMNILPIPALDGGHAFFLLCEVILRRKPSDKFMERAEQVGMTLLILLMAYAIFNDFVRFVF